MATFFRVLTAATAIAVVSLESSGTGAQAGAGGPRDRAAALRRQGLDLGYNLDHAAALDVFAQAIAADPAHPAAYRMVAATLWVNVLFRLGAVTAEDFLGQAGANAVRPKVADVDARFRESLNKSIALAEGRLRERPADPDAHYQIGAGYGFLATYTATVEGSMTSAVGPSRRAYSEHNRVLQLDPNRRDAGLIVGLYRYGVSTLGLLSRFIANLAGFSGGRERGIQLVEAAAAHPSDVQTNARFSLIVIYNREKRYDDALRVIAQLQQQFPRNRLLWLEAGSTALRAGRAAEAKAALDHGLMMLAADNRPRAFGEVARWRYQHGLALSALGQSQPAAAEFRAALSGDAHGWLRGRTHLELGRLSTRGFESMRAREELRLAVELCSAAKDNVCLKDARDLSRRTR